VSVSPISRNDAPILVAGATGNQGGATARRLLADGWPVRAVVRDPAAPAARALTEAGAELVRGDFDDRASLAAAFDGVHAAFGVPPVAFGPNGFDPDTEARRGRDFIDAAVAAGVSQIVFSTVASASGAPDASAGTIGKLRIEDYLREHVAQPTVLRPVRFMTNYLSFGFAGIDGIADGVHRHLFPPDEPMQVIALEDIAEFAALAFAQPDRFAGRTLELAGDQPTPVQAAAAITEATGLPVRYRQLTGDELAAIRPEIAETGRRWQAGHRWHADIEALRVIHPGLRTFADWLAESGAAALLARYPRTRSTA
jgi:uncharacterized protein YbjT (DUF2867 family)